VGRAVSHAGQATLHLTLLPGKTTRLKSRIAPFHASLPSSAQAGDTTPDTLRTPCFEAGEGPASVRCVGLSCVVVACRLRRCVPGPQPPDQSTTPVHAVSSTTRPNAIRYQANGTKVCRDT
jgi:hypothetical protein